MNYEICNNSKCKNCGKCSNTIILLDNNNIDQALPTFTNIIKEVKEKKNWKNKNNKDSYYAIGAIGKSNENKEYLTIKSYCSTYEKDFKSNTKMLNLNWYFESAQEELITTKSCKIFKESVICGLVNLINKNQYKYNKNEFIKLLNEEFISVKNALNIKIIEWTEFLYFNSIDSNNWDNFIKDIFDILKEFNIDKNNNNVKKFIKYQEFYNTDLKGNEKTKNIYTNPETGISVKLSTIHGVKGQTHDATLLLETHCYGHADIEELFELILNKDNEKEYNEIIKNLSNKTKDKSLPAVYVAITRPKHLLCIAMREGVLSNEFKINTLIEKLEKELENKKLEKTKEKYRNNIYKLQQEKQENKEKNTKKLQELGWNIVYARSPKE
jgi:DNA helicase II / ATP-dependent DNA helicase PcrA